MYNPLPPAVGGAIVGVLPMTGVAFSTVLLAAIALSLVVGGLLLVRISSGCNEPRFPAQD